jgi:hypothetical protein
MGSLAVDRQTAPMAQPAITAQIHQPFNIHRGLSTQITFDLEIAINGLTDAHDLLFRELTYATLHRNANMLADRPRFGATDPIDIRERNDDPLLGRYIHACYAGQRKCSLILGIKRKSQQPGAF